GASRREVLRLTNDPEPIDRRWQQQPGVYRFLPIAPLKPDVRSLLMDSESALPVLTESRRGVGRAFMVGINETWRWRYKVGERDQDRLWLQLVRYAAEEPYAAVDGRVALDADAIEISPAGSLRVRARILGEDDLPAKDVTANLKVLRDQSVFRTQPMNGADARFTATLSDLPEGAYELQLDAGPALPHPTIP